MKTNIIVFFLIVFSTNSIFGEDISLERFFEDQDFYSITTTEIVLSPSQKYLAIAGAGVGIVIFDVRLDAMVYHLPDKRSFASGKNGVFWCDEDRVLLADEKRIIIIDVVKKKLIFEYQIKTTNNKFDKLVYSVFTKGYCFFATSDTDSGHLKEIFKINLENYKIELLINIKNVNDNYLYKLAFATPDFLYIYSGNSWIDLGDNLKKVNFHTTYNKIHIEPVKVKLWEKEHPKIITKNKNIFFIFPNEILAYSYLNLEKLFEFKKKKKWFKKNLRFIGTSIMSECNILITQEYVSTTFGGGQGKIRFYDLNNNFKIFEYALKNYGVPYSLEYIKTSSHYKFFIGCNTSMETFEVPIEIFNKKQKDN